jgi:hypothetical protein
MDGQVASRHIWRAFQKSCESYDTWKVRERDGITVLGVFVHDGNILAHCRTFPEGA